MGSGGSVSVRAAGMGEGISTIRVTAGGLGDGVSSVRVGAATME